MLPSRLCPDEDADDGECVGHGHGVPEAGVMCDLLLRRLATDH